MIAPKAPKDTQVTPNIRTIRQRVAAIKKNWSPEQVAERAVEGRRRRRSLASLIESLEQAGFFDDSSSGEVCSVALVG